MERVRRRLEIRTRKRYEPPREAQLVPQARCPKCGQWADVDQEQMRSEVSMVCGYEECGWHGYIDGRTA